MNTSEDYKKAIDNFKKLLFPFPWLRVILISRSAFIKLHDELKYYDRLCISDKGIQFLKMGDYYIFQEWEDDS